MASPIWRGIYVFSCLQFRDKSIDIVRAWQSNSELFVFCCNRALSVANVEFLSHWIDKVIQTLWTDCSVQNTLQHTNWCNVLFLNKWSKRLLHFRSRLWSIDPHREGNTSLSLKLISTPNSHPVPMHFAFLTPTSFSLSLFLPPSFPLPLHCFYSIFPSPEINKLSLLWGFRNLPVCQRVQLSYSG